MRKSSDSSSGSTVSTTQMCRPGNLQGTRINSTTAVLTWDEPYSTCHLCPDAVGYEISGGGIAKIEVLRPPHELGQLNPNVQYRIFVRAKAAGNIVSDPSYVNIRSSPGMPGNLRATGYTQNGFTLNWIAPDGGEPVFDYLVICNGQTIASVRGLTYLMRSPTSLTPNIIEVRARSARSNLSDPAVLDITPPEKPTGLVALNLSTRATALVWNRAADNVAVVEYEILKGDVVIDKTKDETPAYLAIGLTPETQYRFAVQALDAAGNRSEASDAIVVETPLLDPPKNVRVVSVSRSSITLAWNRPDGAIGLVGYKSEADNHKGSTREIQSPVQGVVFTFLRPSSTYTVKISGHDASQRYSEPFTLEVTTSS
ncbi:fibronectin type III domain-containing protein [Pseudomonas umsongensis]|uniref:fibronectin type III domain-containing protein n=1 Tax=Pseudomonas umsongensis TaxID=198618 RepID=UPI0015BC696D|nr:fibronectin type III domain-containing protein [Pseudomonas umsongensis]NWL20967.1 hypothetical protein [Pseudomonas umsongensis]